MTSDQNQRTTQPARYENKPADIDKQIRYPKRNRLQIRYREYQQKLTTNSGKVKVNIEKYNQKHGLLIFRTRRERNIRRWRGRSAQRGEGGGGEGAR